MVPQPTQLCTSKNGVFVNWYRGAQRRGHDCPGTVPALSNFMILSILICTCNSTETTQEQSKEFARSSSSKASTVTKTNRRASSFPPQTRTRRQSTRDSATLAHPALPFRLNYFRRRGLPVVRRSSRGACGRKRWRLPSGLLPRYSRSSFGRCRRPETVFAMPYTYNCQS